MKSLKKYSSLILLAILLGGFLVRFYGFSNPIADWHSWRQSETAAVSRNFAENGIDLLHPKMYNISNVQSGFDNPQAYFLVEMPLYNALQAGLFNIFGILTVEQWGRIVTMLASVGAGLFLYLIVKRHSNATVGLWSAFFYMFIPFNIYYGRVILPDVSMVMATLGAIYFFDRWLDEIKKKKKKNKNLFMFPLAILFTALALLLKPHSVFFLLPILYLAINTFGIGIFKQWRVYLYALLSLAPLAAWRLWIMQYPEGVPSNAWLFNSNGIRFRPSFFRWIFYERLTVLIGGYTGVLFVLLGVWKIKVVKEWKFFATFFASSLLFVSVVATGNVQHDYYQIAAMPSIAIAMGFGAYFLSQWKFNKINIGIGLVIITITSSFYFSWSIVKEYFNINNRSLLSAGSAVQKYTPKDALIIANYNGDSSVLYAMQRKGWASYQEDVSKLVEKGADYLVLINPSQEERKWEKEYAVIEFTKEYAIFDLHKKP